MSGKLHATTRAATLIVVLILSSAVVPAFGQESAEADGAKTSAKESKRRTDDKLKSMSQRLFSGGKASAEMRTSKFGTEWEGRVIAGSGLLPLAIGASFTESSHLKRASAGFSWEAWAGTSLTVIGQSVDQSAQTALGLPSNERLFTNGISSKFQHRFDAIADGRVSLIGAFDYWNAPGKILIDDSSTLAKFNGALGYRAAPGLRFDYDENWTANIIAGAEKSLLNGVNGEYLQADLKGHFGRFGLGITGWQSANFGKGTQLTLSYTFESGLSAAIYGGYINAPSSATFGGVKFSVPLGAPSAFEGSTNLVAELDRQFTIAQQTLNGMPASARKNAITIVRKPVPIFYPFQTVYGDVCTTNTPTPGCTFDRNALRITVNRDGDYNSHGNGSDDLWYVQFDAVGNGYVYDRLGHFQYLADASSFAGYISGTTIGVGTNGFYWENVANGTYWLGQNGVLYSANVGETRYSQAVN